MQIQPEPITHYTHTTAGEPVAPDPQPGYYYVSVRNGSQEGVLLGPFLEHQQALDWVETCRDYANQQEPWSHFYEFGTRRFSVEIEQEKLPNGTFNTVFPDAPGLITRKP